MRKIIASEITPEITEAWQVGSGPFDKVAAILQALFWLMVDIIFIGVLVIVAIIILLFAVYIYAVLLAPNLPK